MKQEVNYNYHERGTKDSRWFRLDHKWLNTIMPSHGVGQPGAANSINENTMQPMYAQLNQAGYTCYLDNPCRCLWVEADSDSVETLLIMMVGEDYDVVRVIGRGTVAILEASDDSNNWYL